MSTTPMSWTKTKQIALSDDWSPFIRHPHIEKAYTHHKQTTVNITDYILHIEMESRPVKVMHNNFPYFVSALHYLCFFLNDNYRQEAVAHITEIFKSTDYIYNQNPNPHLRSVKHVPCYHIFVNHTTGKLKYGNQVLQLIEARLDKKYPPLTTIL